MTNKKKAQFSVLEGVKDERFPKLVGLLFLFLTLYLFVAYTSYLFTWQEDQDKAGQISILWSPESKVDNALGRLGAFISHSSFKIGRAHV